MLGINRIVLAQGPTLLAIGKPGADVNEVASGNSCGALAQANGHVNVEPDEIEPLGSWKLHSGCRTMDDAAGLKTGNLNTESGPFEAFHRESSDGGPVTA
jgi:hypothetical protein